MCEKTVGELTTFFSCWDTRITRLEKEIATVVSINKELRDILKLNFVTPAVPPTVPASETDNASLSDSNVQSQRSSTGSDDHDFIQGMSEAKQLRSNMPTEDIFLKNASIHFESKILRLEKDLKNLQEEREILRRQIKILLANGAKSASLPTYNGVSHKNGVYSRRGSNFQSAREKGVQAQSAENSTTTPDKVCTATSDTEEEAAATSGTSAVSDRPVHLRRIILNDMDVVSDDDGPEDEGITLAEEMSRKLRVGPHSILQCEICKIIFSKKKRFKKHMVSVHNYKL